MHVALLILGVMTVVSLALLSLALPAAAQTTQDEAIPVGPPAPAILAADPGNPFTAGGPQAPGFARGVLDRERAAAEYERLVRQGMHPREAEDTARLRHTANTATD